MKIIALEKINTVVIFFGKCPLARRRVTSPRLLQPLFKTWVGLLGLSSLAANCLLNITKSSQFLLNFRRNWFHFAPLSGSINYCIEITIEKRWHSPGTLGKNVSSQNFLIPLFVFKPVCSALLISF